VPTVIDDASVGFAGTEMRLVVTGSTAELYLDGSGIAAATGTTTLLTGTKSGFWIGGPLSRLDTIEVRAA
jgi:hypothetical protein